MLRIAYIYKKEDCDCRYCLYYSKGKCKLQWCCCYQDKVRTGSPFTSNMKIIIKRRKEQHDQLKNQNEWYCAKPHTALSRSIHSRHLQLYLRSLNRSHSNTWKDTNEASTSPSVLNYLIHIQHITNTLLTNRRNDAIIVIDIHSTIYIKNY